MQEAVEKREAEIVRLGAEAAESRDLDVTALQYRSEAQENLILQLNEQVPSALFLSFDLGCIIIFSFAGS